MEILVFLLGLGCLVLFVWAIAFIGSLISGWKYRRSRPQGRLPSMPPESTSEPTSVAVKPRKAIAQARPVTGFALKQPPVPTRVRLPSLKHQRYIRQATLVLEQLRSREVHLPKALGILRKMNPYAFEELLLTCCHERGWKIERNFKYSNDGGIDGRVTIAGRLYLIQAKRYWGYINPQHIQKFHRVIQQEEATGGFFIHTGKTGEMSKELLQECHITLLSGQKLVNFVLGLRFKILG